MIHKLSHAEISANRQKLESLDNKRRMPVSLLLHSIRSGYNVGSLFRTADACFLEKIYLTGYTATPEQSEVSKTALGATESIPWEYHQDPIELALAMKNKGIKLVALELTDSGITYSNYPKEEFPLCLIPGNEITGVAKELLDLCDYAIEIPQFGIKQSMNIAVSTGIALYELRKIYSNNFTK